MHVGKGVLAIRVELLVLAGSLGFSAAVPAGCGASGPGVDGGEPDAISCEELHMRWSGEVGAIDRSCTIDADCAAFGGGWCTSAHIDVSCTGVALNASAFAGSEAARLEQEFHARSCPYPSTSDCQPAIVRCVGAQCTITGVRCTCLCDAGAGDGGDP